MTVQVTSKIKSDNSLIQTNNPLILNTSSILSAF